MKRLVSCFLISTGIIAVLYYLFNPTYHTNDDNQWIWMLEAIGANSKAPPTAYTVYQHFLLGHIYQILPDYLDIFGYNWMHILSQIMFLTASIKLLITIKSYNPFISIFYAVSLSLVNFFLPQYSITPILLLASSLIFLSQSKTVKDLYSVGSIILIIWASMIRIEPFVFSVIVLTPYVIKILKGPHQRISLSLGILLSVGLAILNYTGTKSSTASGFFFKDLDRKIILDYKGRDYFYQNPEALKNTGLSINDARFFGHWLLLDPEINKKILDKKTIEKINFSFTTRLNWGVESISFLLEDRNLRYLFLLFVISVFCAKNSYAFLSCFIFLSAIFYSGYLGRTPLIRVYIGPLMVLSLLNISFVSLNKKRSFYIIGAAVSLLFMTIRPLAHKTLWKEKTAKKRLIWVLDEMEKTNSDIIWWPFATNFGDDFYRIKNIPNIRKFSFVRPNYNWGDAKDPQAKNRHKKFKEDFPTKGISLVVDHLEGFPKYLPIFKDYCKEHFDGELKDTYVSKDDNTISIATLKCIN